MSPQEIVVQKFGGTSVGNIERIRAVAELVKKNSQDQSLVVVVSAMAGQTNQLVDWAKELSAEPKLEAYDMLLASGEQVTCALLAIALENIGVKAVPLLGFQVGIETDELYSKAKIQNIKTDVLKNLMDQGEIPIVAGFQGVHHQNSRPTLTTLGRGGSDTSAVAIAVALKAKRCDIYTDVDGVYTADPRAVPDAKKIERVTFSEMMELASLGAKVLHMRCVELAAKHAMPLQVLSSFKPEIAGTFIVGEDAMLESSVVTAITSDSAQALLELRLPEKLAQFPAPYFRSLANEGINVDVIVKSPVGPDGHCSVSFTVPKEDERRAHKLLEKFQVKTADQSLVKVSIVGLGMHTHSGVAASMFEVLEKAQIPVFLVSTSEIKVSVLIPESAKNQAVKLLHEAFIGSDETG